MSINDFSYPAVVAVGMWGKLGRFFAGLFQAAAGKRRLLSLSVAASFPQPLVRNVRPSVGRK